MFYNQCGQCGERWEIGTASTCKCPKENMNQQQRAVVQQALEAMGNITNYERLEKARAALRQLLEQPEPVQEPDIFPDEAYEMGLERIAYYTTPPAQPTGDKLTPDEAQPATWVGLTADEMLEALIAVDPTTKRLPIGFTRFAQAIEAKLKEKNGGAA